MLGMAAPVTELHPVAPPKESVPEEIWAGLAEGSAEPQWSVVQSAFQRGGCTRLHGDLRSLVKAVEHYEAQGGLSFWCDLLPFACKQAQRFDELFPLRNERIVIVDDSTAAEQSRVVEWDQAQCLCIQCNALLCAWPKRTSSNCRCIEPSQLDLPSINLDEMLCGRGNFVPQVAKCEMFLHYLAKQKQRLDDGSPLDRKISFVRRKIETTTGSGECAAGVRPEPEWSASGTPLGAVVVKPLRESIDAAKDMLRADFANESIGGGSIAYGCVQEEIMFACHPELNCARLIFTPMRENEAFVLVGAEQFAEPRGYAFNLECGGAYDDETPLQPPLPERLPPQHQHQQLPQQEGDGGGGGGGAAAAAVAPAPTAEEGAPMELVDETPPAHPQAVAAAAAAAAAPSERLDATSVWSFRAPDGSQRGEPECFRLLPDDAVAKKAVVDCVAAALPADAAGIAQLRVSLREEHMLEEDQINEVICFFTTEGTAAAVVGGAAGGALPDGSAPPAQAQDSGGGGGGGAQGQAATATGGGDGGDGGGGGGGGGGGQLRAFVTAIDAMDYRHGQNLAIQYQEAYVRRCVACAFRISFVLLQLAHRFMAISGRLHSPMLEGNLPLTHR